MAQGTISTKILIAALAAVIVVGGGIYLAVQKNSSSSSDTAVVPARSSESETDAGLSQSGNLATREECSGERPACGEGQTLHCRNGKWICGGEAQPVGRVQFSGTVLAGRTSPLLDFNKADYDKALASDKLVVLYFYANWCPICRRETVNALYPAFNELTDDTVVGFRVNYNDNETDADEKELAREFGVAYQHTKVFLKNGQRILKSPEEWNEARYDQEISNALR